MSKRFEYLDTKDLNEVTMKALLDYLGLEVDTGSEDKDACGSADCKGYTRKYVSISKKQKRYIF